MQEKKQETPKHKTKIGGQALIEGVMMKGTNTGAMACRLPDGTIDVEMWPENNGKNMPWYCKCPLVCSVFNFVISLVDGYRCLMKSAEKQVDEDEEANEKAEKAEKNVEKAEKAEANIPEVEKKDPFFSVVMGIGVVVGLAAAVLLFVWLPKFLVGGLIRTTPIADDSRLIRSLLEGILKIALFLLYTGCSGLMKEMRRTYEYHSAEHKTIACYEAGEELTVEHVKTHTRFHPRCGTSFIFITLIVSILVMCLVLLTVVWQRVLVSILLLPVVMGISYEFIRLAGRSDSRFTWALSWPGLQIQRMTTREPDDGQIECAIVALKPCIPENLEDDQW